MLTLRAVGDFAMVQCGGGGRRGTCGFAWCSTSWGCGLMGGPGGAL